MNLRIKILSKIDVSKLIEKSQMEMKRISFLLNIHPLRYTFILLTDYFFTLAILLWHSFLK